MDQSQLWQNIQNILVTPLKNGFTACLYGRQQNIKALGNSNYFELIGANHLKSCDILIQVYKGHHKSNQAMQHIGHTSNRQKDHHVSH